MTDSMLTMGLVLLPMAAAALLACLPRQRSLLHGVALVALGVQVLFITAVYFGTSAHVAVEAAWLPALGSQIYLYVDGINAQALFVLTAVLVAAVIAEMYLQQDGSCQARLALVFVVAAALNLLLLSRDILLAAAAHGTAGLALAALLGIGSGLAAQSAARRFAHQAVVGTILLSVSAAILAASAGSTVLDDLTRIDPGEIRVPTRIAAILLMVAVALQVPLIPLHTWLAPVVAAGSIAGRMLVLGGWCTAGAFCLLRFGLGLFPDLLAYAAPIPLLWGVATIVYAAILAIVQYEMDLLRRLSWSTLGAGGLLLVGVAGLDELPILGAWMHASVQALPRAGLVLLAYWISATGARRGSVAAVWVALAIVLAAAPGAGLFPGWLLVLSGTADAVVVGLLMVAGAAIGFALIVPAMHFSGPPPGPPTGPPMPASLSRILAMVMIAVVLAGLAPGPLVSRAQADVESLLERATQAPGTDDEAAIDGDGGRSGDDLD